MNLNQRIKKFYDQSTPLWLEVWGEHMHHGYYGATDAPKNHAQAQVDLVEKMLAWGNVKTAKQILDAGCGVGGSARYLAKKYNAKVLGVTLSSVQAAEGNQISKTKNLDHQVILQVKDMMQLGKEKQEQYDLIWSMESAEHIADKQALLDMFYQLLKPGGQFLMATWCHRNEPPNITTTDQHLLEKVYNLYHLPPMVSVNHLEKLARQAGFQDLKTDDWSDGVAPFWKAVIRSVFSFKSINGLLKAGWPTIKGAWAMRYMTAGYKKNLIKFGVLQGKKI